MFIKKVIYCSILLIHTKQTIMKTVFEKGTKKYLVKFVGDPHWMFTTSIFQERFVVGGIYKIFKMKNGFQVTIQGEFETEAGKKKKSSRTYLTSQTDFLKRNFEYC